MKVYDLYVDGKGVFHYINELVDPESLMTLPDTQTTDLLFVGMHGSREVSPLVQRIVKGEGVTEADLRQLASLLYGMYGSKWESLDTVYKTEIPLETYRLITTESIDDLGESTMNTDTTRTDKKTDQVSGYNSIEFVDDTQDTTESKDVGVNTGTNKLNRTRTTEVRGNTGNALDDRKKALDMITNNLLVKDVFKDVSETLGTLIY